MSFHLSQDTSLELFDPFLHATISRWVPYSKIKTDGVTTKFNWIILVSFFLHGNSSATTWSKIKTDWEHCNLTSLYLQRLYYLCNESHHTTTDIRTHTHTHTHTHSYTRASTVPTSPIPISDLGFEPLGQRVVHICTSVLAFFLCSICQRIPIFDYVNSSVN